MPSEGTNATLNIPGGCPYCSSPSQTVIHGGTCPRVKAIEYDQYGCVKRVEFHPPKVIPDAK